MPPRVTLIRHAEALHNPLVNRGKAEGNEELLRQGRSILNPSLSETGRAQAAKLHEELLANGTTFDLVVTTPLARTIETTQIALCGLAKRVLLTPELCETAEARLGGPQRGFSLEKTQHEYPQLAGGGAWDVSHVREAETAEGPANWVAGEPCELVQGGYQHPLPVEERLDAALEWLKQLPEPNVAVVGHSGVLDRIAGRQTQNCECLEHTLEPAS